MYKVDWKKVRLLLFHFLYNVLQGCQHIPDFFMFKAEGKNVFVESIDVE
jgi:hypothetical protein